jgi:hypothetical protein
MSDQKQPAKIPGSKLTKEQTEKVAHYVFDQFRARKTQLFAVFRTRMELANNPGQALEMAIALFGSALIGAFALEEQGDDTKEIFDMLVGANQFVCQDPQCDVGVARTKTEIELPPILEGGEIECKPFQIFAPPMEGQARVRPGWKSDDATGGVK